MASSIYEILKLFSGREKYNSNEISNRRSLYSSLLHRNLNFEMKEYKVVLHEYKYR